MEAFNDLARRCVSAGLSRKDALDYFDRALVREAIQQMGSKSGAAKYLDVHRNTVQRHSEKEKK